MIIAKDVFSQRIAASQNKPLSFEILKGEKVWIRGANGSGKTSLLKLISRLLKPDAGHISHRGNVSFFSNGNGLYDHLKISDHDAYFGDSAPIFFQDDIDCYVHALSTGQKKRLSLDYYFQSLVDIYLMDEPFANLDQETSQHLLKYILSRDETVLVADHGVVPVGFKIIDL
jgi:ABC-type transport system involved in cytochrome c biogenesis ATPase subunit